MMLAEVTLETREPIKRTAKRIGISAKQAIRHCRAGKLAHVRDGAGHYFSSRAAAEAFMGFKPTDLDRERAAREIMQRTVWA